MAIFRIIQAVLERSSLRKVALRIGAHIGLLVHQRPTLARLSQKT